MNEKRNSNLVWWILGAVLVLACCCLLFLMGAGGILFGIWSSSTTQDAPVIVTVEAQLVPVLTPAPGLTPAGPAPTPMASGAATPQPGAALPAVPPAELSATEQQLQEAVVPPRDLRVLAEGLLNTGPIPEVVWDTPPVYTVGDTERFWVSDQDNNEHMQIEARLVYMNDVLYMWVEDGVRFNLDRIRRSADKFANETYPTSRSFFGSEWSPGIDNDPRLHILHSVQIGSRIAGYFSGADAVSNLAQPFSNQREMFYINPDNVQPDTDGYDSVLAHEFQHMIHWYQDKNEATWVNEGLSELAAYLNGYDASGFDQVFSRVPDTQLNTWSMDPNSRAQHYGSSFLFMVYFLQRFGSEMMQAVVADDANSIDGFNNVLAASGTGLTFDDVFADWTLANLLNDPALADGRFGYDQLRLRPMARDTTLRRFPAQVESDVSQYGTDYVELRGAGNLGIDFRGATTTRLAANEPYSGQYAWWANREDDSDARLTRAFDLSQVDSATLNFQTWHDIEYDWDYGYVMASVDGGETWTILQAEDSVDSNPNGNSFGWAFTGCSGEPNVTEPGDVCNAVWIPQSVDLTPFAGNEEVLVRFQYITDDALTHPGFFVDDVSIPEIDYFDDMESGAEGWVSEGWILTDNMLSQRWLLQLIELEDGQDPVITRIPVDANGVAQWTVENLGRRKNAILAISGLAPVTTEKALYEYTITQE